MKRFQKIVLFIWRAKAPMFAKIIAQGLVFTHYDRMLRKSDKRMGVADWHLNHVTLSLFQGNSDLIHIQRRTTFKNTFFVYFCYCPLIQLVAAFLLIVVVSRLLFAWFEKCQSKNSTSRECRQHMQPNSLVR